MILKGPRELNKRFDYSGRFYSFNWCCPRRYRYWFWCLCWEIKGNLPETCTLERYEVLPVAFGLEKARVRVRYPEEWGGTDKLEEMFGQVDGIQGIEAIAFSKA